MATETAVGRQVLPPLPAPVAVQVAVLTGAPTTETVGARPAARVVARPPGPVVTKLKMDRPRPETVAGVIDKEVPVGLARPAREIAVARMVVVAQIIGPQMAEAPDPVPARALRPP